MDFTEALSDKVLLSIFSYLIEVPSIFPLSAREPSLALLVVCRRWHRVILDRDSPNKWRNVISPTVSSNHFHAKVEVDQYWFDLHIQRHGGHWLNIHLLLTTPPPQNGGIGNTSEEELDVLKNVVFPAAMRVKCLTLLFPSYRAASSFLTTPTRFYFLESIELRFLKDSQSEVAGTATNVMRFSRPITVFHNLSFLRYASIRIHNGLNPLTLPLPWYQLTRINMGFSIIPPKVFMAILSKSSPSISAGFFTVGFSPKQQSPSSYSNRTWWPKIFAPALEYLHLRLINPSFDSDIFTRTHLPALINFRVDLCDSNAGWMLNVYYPLLYGSSNTLRSIAFFNLEGSEGPGRLANHRGGPGRNSSQVSRDMENLFSILPMVRVLQLPLGLYISETAMELISVGRLLPSLDALQVTSLIGSDILTMVKNRNEIANLLSGLVGSSSAVPTTWCDSHRYSPHHCSEVVLCTSAPQRAMVESCTAYIHSLSSMQNTKFQIDYADQSLF